MKIKGCPEPEEKGDCFERFHHAWKYGKIMVQPNGKPDDPDQTMDGSGGCLPRHKWKRKGKRKWKMEMDREAGRTSLPLDPSTATLGPGVPLEPH